MITKIRRNRLMQNVKALRRGRRTGLRNGVGAKQHGGEKHRASRNRSRTDNNQFFRHVPPSGQLLVSHSDRATREACGPSPRRDQGRDEKISGVIYPLLGAASRRFSGISAVDWRACLNLAGWGWNRGIQRWQVMAMYSPQPERLQFSCSFGTEPVISSGSTRR